jgi:hypothetical protein
MSRTVSVAAIGRNRGSWAVHQSYAWWEGSEWPEVLLTRRQVHGGPTAWSVRLVSPVHLVYESGSTVIRCTVTSRRIKVNKKAYHL